MTHNAAQQAPAGPESDQAARSAAQRKLAAKDSKEKQEQDRQARLARKLERADDLDHLVLWLRTNDAQVLRAMLYPFDRSLARVRAITASLELPLAEGREALAKGQAWLDQLEGVAHAGSSGQEMSLYPPAMDEAPRAEVRRSMEEKQAIRAYRRAIAGQYGVDFYLPRSPEGRRFAQAISALDARLIRARALESLDEAGDTLTRVGQIIRTGHELVVWLTRLTSGTYEPHPLLKRALKAERSRSTVEEIVAQAEHALLE